MAERTLISWTSHTWNPWHGCHAVSPGCDHCYAEAAHKRAGWDFGNVVRSKTTWNDPRRWQKALKGTEKREMVFTCSWSDFFLPEADNWRGEAWSVIRSSPNLIWQVLTKRPGLIPKRLPADWGDGYPNLWLGVSVESKAWLWRIPELKKVPAAVHFLSLEPLIEPLMPELADYLDHIEWAIVGGESGNGTPNFRPMDHQWARDIFAECSKRGIARFFKQSSGFRTETGTKLDGQFIREYPGSAPAEARQGGLF
jgi:protein gp37